MHTRDWYIQKEGRAYISDPDKEIIQREWKELTNREFFASFNQKCQNCYNDAIIMIIRAMGKSDNGGYELKSGVSFRYKGKVYTRLNITPQAAEWYIKQDLNRRDEFTSLAKDYDSYASTQSSIKDGE